MKKHIVLAALAVAITACEGPSPEGSWLHERGGVLTFAGDGSVKLEDAQGTYSGKWKATWVNRGSSLLEMTLDGLPGHEKEKCNYQITVESGVSTLWVEGCIFTGILRKR